MFYPKTEEYRAQKGLRLHKQGFRYYNRNSQTPWPEYRSPLVIRSGDSGKAQDMQYALDRRRCGSKGWSDGLGSLERPCGRHKARRIYLSGVVYESKPPYHRRRSHLPYRLPGSLSSIPHSRHSIHLPLTNDMCSTMRGKVYPSLSFRDICHICCIGAFNHGKSSYDLPLCITFQNADPNSHFLV